MRMLVPLAILALAVSACGKDEAAPSAASKGSLTIKTDPATLPVSKGKLAVLPKDTPAETAATAAPAPPPPEAAAPVAAGPEVRPPPLDAPAPPADRWARAPDLSARDCKRAARVGDPLAESAPCQDVLAAEEEDERLAADCMDAQAEGHPFGWSAACRRVMPPR